MKTRTLAGLTLALVSGCADGLGFGEGCTTIGCLSFVRVELAFASELPPDTVQVVVEQDGVSFTCDFGAASDPCHKGFQPDFDPGAASGGTEGDRLVVLLDDTPEELRITVTSASGSETKVVRPEYQRSQPNGPDCEPICRSSSSSLAFAL